MKQVRKTKIVATLGPASDRAGVDALLKAGTNAVRLNFSHGTQEEHRARIDQTRKHSLALRIPVAVIQDLRGPKIRTGDLKTETVTLKKGATVTLTTKNVLGDAHLLSVSHKSLPLEVKKGTSILLDDGKIRLQVRATDAASIACRVLEGGTMKGRRGVNVPGASLSIPALTPKDKKDVLFGVSQDVDFIALSFVKTAKDIKMLKGFIEKHKGNAGVIAKIETPEAVENIDEIMQESAAVMIARGDLAVEIPAEEVPLIQKRIIKKCRRAGKPVIVATQMLESMISSSVPTRAEVNDIANAILDGADAVMLSGETAAGAYPLGAVQTMAKVAARTEAEYPHQHFLEKRLSWTGEETQEIVSTITHGAATTAWNTDAKVIVALTESGFTARMVARYRPQQPILALTPNKKALPKMLLTFGCIPYSIGSFQYVGQATERIRELLLKEKLAKRGDTFVITAGVPFGKAGGTNLVIAQTV